MIMKTRQQRNKHFKSLEDEIYARIDWEKASKLFQKIPTTQTSMQHSYPQVKEILRILAGAGAVGLMFAFPGAAPAIGKLFFGKKEYPRWQTKHIISRLAKRKLVAIENNKDGSVTVKITKEGLSRAFTYQLESMQLIKTKRWDKKWRVVIFDIPEKHKRVRDVFRMRLRQLGLYYLQESVYVSPYPCFNEVEFLRELYGIPVKVRYLLVDKIEDDDELKSHFELD